MKWFFCIILLFLSAGCAEKAIVEHEIIIDSKGIHLPGYITRPEKGTKFPAVILINAEKNSDMLTKTPAGTARPFARLAETLAAEGIVVLRYDSRPYVMRENNQPADTLMPQYCAQDAKAALRFIQSLEYVNTNRIIMAAHGLAGNLLLNDADNFPVSGMVMFAPVVLPVDKQLLYRLNYQAEYFAQSELEGSDAMAAKLVSMRHEYRNAFEAIRQGSLNSINGYSAAYWKKLLEETAGFTKQLARAPFPIIIIQGTKDLFNPADLLRQAENDVKNISSIKFEYITGMTHELYDYMTQTFQPDTAEIVYSMLK